MNSFTFCVQQLEASPQGAGQGLPHEKRTVRGFLALPVPWLTHFHRIAAFREKNYNSSITSSDKPTPWKQENVTTEDRPSSKLKDKPLTIQCHSRTTSILSEKKTPGKNRGETVVPKKIKTQMRISPPSTR